MEAIMDERTEVPKGYITDARGNLVRRENVKKIDMDRDTLVRRLFKQSEKVAAQVELLRAESIAAIDALVARCAESYGVNMGGKKGNVCLTSYDGSLRIIRARADRIVFTEQLEVARSLVDECLRDYAKGASKNLKAIIESAFAIDEQGNVSVGKILRLRKIKIDDEKWQRAMQIIADSMHVAGTKEYLRFYGKNAQGEYEQLQLGN